MSEIRAVAASQEKTLAPLTNELPLNDSGLDSLCFAILVARLEDITGRDPMGEAQGGRFPRTIGEFISLYEEVLSAGLRFVADLPITEGGKLARHG